MSGICGVVRFSGVADETAALERCIDLLAHRGRDRGTGSAVLGPAAFGYLYESVHGDPPPCAASADCLLVGDVRLDNRQSVLSGLNLTSADGRDLSDCALILRSYMEWGTRCVDHLVGEFSVAIWDQRVQRLFVFRDHFGQRPLYYYREGGRIAFASEIKGLLAFPWVPCEICFDRVVEFLACQSVDLKEPITYYDGIHRFHAASGMVFTAESMSHLPYWMPDPERQIALGSDLDYVERFLELFHCAVRRRLPARGEVGICLSGGFDSSCIAVSAAAVLRSSGQALKAFVSAPPIGSPDSVQDIRRYCDALSRKLPNLEVNYVTGCGEEINAGPDLFRISEAPTQILQTRLSLLFKSARGQGVQTMLAGYGGDNSVTPRGKGFLAELFLSGKLSPAINELKARSSLIGRSPQRVFFDEVVVPLTPSPLWRAMLRWRHSEPAWQINALCVPAAARRSSLFQQITRNASFGLRGLRSVRAHSCRGLAFNMSGRGMEPVHHLAAHHSMSFNLPMLDKDLVEYCLALPASQHVRSGHRRFLVRRAFDRDLPAEILGRKEQNDFIFPDASIRLSERLDAYAAALEVLEAHAGIAEIVDLDKLRALLKSLKGDGTAKKELHAQLFFRGFDTANFLKWFEAARRDRNLALKLGGAPRQV